MVAVSYREKIGEMFRASQMANSLPEALVVLLHTIHFSKKRRYLKLDVDMQFDVAVLSVTLVTYADL